MKRPKKSKFHISTGAGSPSLKGLKRTVLLVIFMVLGLLAFPGGSSGRGIQDDSFSLKGINTLVVDGSFFNIDIEGQSGATMVAEISISQRLRNRGVTVLHEQRGSELHVKVERPVMSISVRPRETARMEFKVPKNVVVKVSNSSGTVDVTGLTSNEVNLKVSSGRLNSTVA